MLLEDLAELHKNKDLMAGSPEVAPGIDSFNKFEQHKIKSNESTPNKGQQMMNLEEIRQKSLMEREKDLSQNALE